MKQTEQEGTIIQKYIKTEFKKMKKSENKCTNGKINYLKGLYGNCSMLKKSPYLMSNRDFKIWYG